MPSLEPPASPTVEPGLAMPRHTRPVSRAASHVRTAAVTSDLSARELGRPRMLVDQGEVRCCVSCALCGALEILHPEWPALSRMFHYYVTRFDLGGADGAGNLHLDRGIDELKLHGVCRHEMHQVDSPYLATAIAKRPSSKAVADGLLHRLLRKGFHFPVRPLVGASRSADIRDAIRDGHPVVAGFQLPTGYPNGFLNAEREWERPADPSDTAHCVLVVGYSDLRRALHIFDSMNGERFDQGTWWMKYTIADRVLFYPVASTT